MATFETPAAVEAHLDLGMGDVVVTASDTTTTTVTVTPTRATRKADVEAAEGTVGELRDGRLVVRTPKQRYFGLLGRGGAVRVTVELPTGSDVRAQTAYGDLEVRGTLRRVSLKTWAGDLRVDDADEVDATTPAGDVTVGRVEVKGDLRSAAGDVRVEQCHGHVLLKANVGAIRVAEASGELVAVAPYGDITVGRATAGRIVLTTSYSGIEVGIPEGTAARLDVATDHGTIRNDLTPSGTPPEQAQLLELTARTGYGSVVVRRS